jgi:hypothetical protein
MINFEKNLERITTLAEEGRAVGVKNGKLEYCASIQNCRFCESGRGSGRDCTSGLLKWLISEYEEPKINIPEGTPIDDKILVSNDGKKWTKRYYAGVINGVHYVWCNGSTSWSSEKHMSAYSYMKLSEEE